MSKDKDKDEIISEELEKEAEEAVEEAQGENDAENKVKELEETISELKDQMLRDRAETENYRKRLIKDKENAVKYANENLIKDLLDPIDNFSRAIEAAESSEDFASLKDGVKMIESQMMSILKTNWGLETIEAMDKEFDPSEMEAYTVEEREGIEKETVVRVFQTGYRLNGKVVRTAKVMVAKPKA